VTPRRLRVFEEVPAHLEWILEQDRGVSILDQVLGVSILDRDRVASTVVIPVGAEQEGTNVVRRTGVALELATSSLHAPLTYESCRIHPCSVSFPDLYR